MRIHQRAGEALVQLRIGLRGVDLAPHDLALRPGQIEHAIGEAAVAVFVDQRDAGLAIGADAGHHVDDRRLFRRQHDAATDRDHRIEYRAGRVR
jgi:hypothetical protein